MKMKRKEFNELFKNMLTCSVTFIVVVTCIAIIGTSIMECVSAYGLGKASADDWDKTVTAVGAGSNAGHLLVYNYSEPSETDYANFVFNDKSISFVGRGIAWVGFFVFKLSNTGWPPKLAYRFAVSVVWMTVAFIVMIWWVLKRWRAGARVKESKARHGISPVDYEGIKDRCLRPTFLDLGLVLTELVMLILQMFIISASYMMVPMLIVGVTFLLFHIAWQLSYYFSERPDLEY